MKTLDADYFHGLYARSDDPWGYRSRWYEARKRAITAACLPQQRHAHGFEPGCSTGELAAELAPRCARYLATDAEPAAVEIARRRLAAVPQARVQALRLPDQWPAGERFDLIVLSEIGYYLDSAGLQAVVQHCKQSLAPGGVVLGCHWRHPIEGCLLSGDAVQAALQQQLGLQTLVRHVEPDFLLELWSADSRSVAAREGLV